METKNIMSFHYPEGLAAIHDGIAAFHIREDGSPAYAHRFHATFGFYGGVATVADERGFFHIDVEGKSLHEKRFVWSGNFQEALCVVQNNEGFFHVNASGNPAYENRFGYVGDFRNGIAVAHLNGKAFHIRKDGIRLHPHEFFHAEPFHKGFAVVKDHAGFYHIDETGRPIHSLRLKRAEPFYNHLAFCGDAQDNSIRLRENGHYTRFAKNPNPISLPEIRLALMGQAQVALFTRHADRHPIHKDTPNWGNDVRLNETGERRAYEFGKNLTGYQPQAFTSPVYRCQQTAQAILQGIGFPNEPTQVNPILGDPGIYFDYSLGHENEMAKDFHKFMSSYLSTGLAPGMRPLAEASEDLIEQLLKLMSDKPLTFFISHDLHSACFMEFLGLKKPNKEDWCNYLEGICLIRSNGQVEFRRFNGIGEVTV